MDFFKITIKFTSIILETMNANDGLQRPLIPPTISPVIIKIMIGLEYVISLISLPFSAPSSSSSKL